MERYLTRRPGRKHHLFPLPGYTGLANWYSATEKKVVKAPFHPFGYTDGPRPQVGIPANSVLIFETELVDFQ